MELSLLIKIISSIFSLSVGVYSYKKNSVSKSGLIALVGISHCFILLNQVLLLCFLFAMFTSSSLLSKLKEKSKSTIEQKHGARDYIQAFANLGVATICMLLYSFTNNDIFLVALISSVASSNADSWASEIGKLSIQQPIMITNFQPTEKGISGGVTFLGTFGGILGSIFISLITLLSFQQITLSIICLIAGIFGFIMDSYLGVWLQSLYKSKSGELSEIKKEGYVKIKGFDWCNNDMVNFIASLLGAFCGAALMYFSNLLIFN